MESAKSGEVSNLGTPKNQKRCAQCRCKYSRCLRMYCECFASGVYCDGCNCINCYNRKENEADRKEAIDAVLKRNRSAFNRGSGSRSGASVQLSKTSPATLASPKAPYRAELSGSRQPQHVKDLCNDLVGVSVEAAKSFSEERQMVGDGAEVERDETLVGCDEDSKDCQRQQHAVREAADNAPSANTLYIEQERLVLKRRGG